MKIITIAVRTNGLPAFVHTDAKVFTLTLCVDKACQRMTTVTLRDDLEPDSVQSLALRVTPNGLAIVVYFDAFAQTLHLVQCQNTACSQFTDRLLPVQVGDSPSLAIGRDGFPRVAFLGAGGLTLEV